ncbi:hypothetical protein DSECCO2_654720 [anaerobic digester metagenome]
MLEGGLAAQCVHDGDAEQAPAVVGLFGSHVYGARPAVIQEGLQGGGGVLPRQLADARQILGARQLMQPRPDGRVRPPGTERRGEANIDGVAQVVYPGSRIFSGVWINALVDAHGRHLSGGAGCGDR